MKSFAGFGLLWGAYLLAYYGMTCIQHKGVGIIDLAFPSRMPALVAQISGANAPAASGVGPTLHAATPAELGGPLGAGIFLPNAPAAQTSGPLGTGLFLGSGTQPQSGPLGQGLFLP